jgi:hypothetical protein
MQRRVKKTKPFTISSKADATVAFCLGINLTRRERQKVIRRFYQRMTITKACMVAVKHALGKIRRCKSSMNKLTLAWLLIGQPTWKKVMRAAEIVRGVSVSLGTIYRELVRRVTPNLEWA